MEQVIYSTIALIGTIISFKFNGLYHKLISIGITISILLTWTGSPFLLIISYISLLILAISTFIYGLSNVNLSNLEQICLITMGALLSISFIFSIIQTPGGEKVNITLAIPIILTIITYRKHRHFTKEMSFLFFWCVFAIFEFFRLWI